MLELDELPLLVRLRGVSTEKSVRLRSGLLRGHQHDAGVRPRAEHEQNTLTLRVSVCALVPGPDEVGSGPRAQAWPVSWGVFPDQRGRDGGGPLRNLGGGGGDRRAEHQQEGLPGHTQWHRSTGDGWMDSGDGEHRVKGPVGQSGDLARQQRPLVVALCSISRPTLASEPGHPVTRGH